MMTFAVPYRKILAVFVPVVVLDAAISAVNPLILRALIDNGIEKHRADLGRPADQQVTHPVRELVHVVPPRAGDDQFPQRLQDGWIPESPRRGCVEQRDGGVPFLAIARLPP